MSFRYIFNILLFQFGWFACLWLGNLGGAVAVLGILIVHFYYIVKPVDRYAEVLLLIKVLAIGAVVETAYLMSGVLLRSDGLLIPPLWLLLLWVLFATTLNYSLSWLQHRQWLAALLVIVAAPASYFAGATISDSMSLAASTSISLGVVGISWAMIFPLLLRWAQRAPVRV